MSDQFTVVVAAPAPAPAAAAALAGRASDGQTEALVYSSDELACFFEPQVQRRLPSRYDLVLCGLEVAHVDWDGRPVRPQLMDRLRRFVGTIQWYSDTDWDPEDLRAIEHLIGRERVCVAPGASSVAAVVQGRLSRPAGDYGERLVRFAEGRLDEDDERQWGAGLRRVIGALKGDRAALAGVVAAMIEERLARAVAEHIERAEAVEGEIRRLAEQRAGKPVQVGERSLVCVAVPAAKQAFWAEVSAFAREATGADVSLCRLEGRPTVVLACAESARLDLRPWARYVTDAMPGAQAVGPRRDAVPLVIAGLHENAALLDAVLRALQEGAHLLRESW